MISLYQYIAQVQIRKGEISNLNNLPGGLTGDNVSKGLAVAFGIAGGIALVIVAYGGLKFVLSQGNPQEISKAKNTIIDGLIGLAIIVSAGGIVAFVMAALK